MENEEKPSEETKPTPSEMLTQIKQENERLEKNLKELADVKAQDLLSGKSGLPQQTEPEKEPTGKELREQLEKEAGIQ